MGQGQRRGTNLDGQPYQAKRPGRAGRLYLDGSECQLDGMANERVAEKCPLEEGRQVSWSLPRGLAPCTVEGVQLDSSSDEQLLSAVLAITRVVVVCMTLSSKRVAEVEAELCSNL